MKGFAKVVAVLFVSSLVLTGLVYAGENNRANVSAEDAERLALEHQTNGNKYDDNGKFKEAIEEYKKSLEYSPDNSDTLFNLGVIYLKTNKAQDAATTLEKLVKISADDSEAYNLLGIAYKGCGKEKDAKMAWEKSLKINPEQPKVKEMINEIVSKK